MATDGPPRGSDLIFWFLEMVALAIVFAAVDLAKQGEWRRSGIAILWALAFAAIGVAIPWIVKKIRQRKQKIKRSPPCIEIRVTNGERACVVVTNAGGAFSLVTRARIIAASNQLPIAYAASYEFRARDVGGKLGESTFTIATVNDTKPPGVSVKVRGEDMVEIQYWHQAASNLFDFWFDIEWTFLERTADAHLRDLSVIITRVTFESQGRLLRVVKIDVPHKHDLNSGIISVNVARP